MKNNHSKKQNKGSIIIWAILILILIGVSVFFALKIYSFKFGQNNAEKIYNQDKVEKEEIPMLSYSDSLVLCQRDGMNNLFRGIQNDIDDVNYFTLVLKSLIERDPKYCDMADKGGKKEKCLVDLANYSMLRGEGCDKIGNPIMASVCQAVANKDRKIISCNGSADAKSKQICEALSSGKIDDCSVVPTGVADIQKFTKDCQRGFMLTQASLENKGISSCDSIKDEDIMNSVGHVFCRTLFLNKEDALSELNNFFNEKVCYSKYGAGYAFEKKDKSICEKIPWSATTNKQSYDTCVDAFKE